MKPFILCIYYNLKNVKSPKHTEDINILNGSYNPVQIQDTGTSVFPRFVEDVGACILWGI